MDIGIISARYAKALFLFANLEKQTDIVYSEMSHFRQLFMQMEELRKVATNPLLSADCKTEFFIEACRSKAGADVSKCVCRFLSLAVQKGRAEFLPFIATAYIGFYEKEQHITRAQLITAQSLNDDSRSRILRIIEKRTGNTIRMEEKTDRNLKAGFILTYDDYRVDASLRGQLKRLSRRWN